MRAERFPQMAREHPMFDQSMLPPGIPLNWEDESWHNDACPMFSVPLAGADDSLELRVAFNWLGPDGREETCFSDPYSAWFNNLRTGTEVHVYTGGDFDELVRCVERVRMAVEGAIGLAPEPRQPVTFLQLATPEEVERRFWMLVDPSRPMGACALGYQGHWVDPSNDCPRLFRDHEIGCYHLEPGWVWQEHDAQG